MAITYKILGQVVSDGTAGLQTLYSVPTGYSSATSTLSVCNLTGSAATYRIAVRPANAAIQMKHYIAYDAPVYPYDTIPLNIAITLAAGDVVSVQGSVSNISYSLFGSEINS
jgi:hypothetical protein